MSFYLKKITFKRLNLLIFIFPTISLLKFYIIYVITKALTTGILNMQVLNKIWLRHALI